MARNGSGTMSVPNTLVSGQPITASGHNQNYSDIANEITNSVAADGQTTITGVLKGAAGTAAAPSYTFSSDLDTGAYHSAANKYGIAAGGAQVAEFSASGVDAVAGNLLQGGNILLPPGVTVPYAGATAPAGWLLCYGQAVSRTTYAALFTALSTTFGSGDGSTTFNLPDLRGRCVAGVDPMGGTPAGRLTATYFGAAGALGATGGVENRSIGQANLPNYTMTANISGLTGSLSFSGAAGTTFAGDNAGKFSNPNGTAISGYNTNVTFGGSVTVPSGGSGTALATVQPTIQLNYIIKT